MPKQERSKESRSALLNAGLKLFSKKGFYQTNSKQIAKEAGVSIGTFYMYFADKKDLFHEVLRAYHAKIKRVMESIAIEEYVNAGDGRGFLVYIIDKLIAAHDIHPEFHQEFAAMAQSDPEIRAINEHSKNESLAITKRMLTAWKPSMRIADGQIDAAAVVVQHSIEEIVHTVLFSNLKISTKRIISELVDMLSCYLFAEP